MRQPLEERNEIPVQLSCLKGRTHVTGVFDQKGNIVGMLDSSDKEHDMKKWEKALGAIEVVCMGKLVYRTD